MTPSTRPYTSPALTDLGLVHEATAGGPIDGSGTLCPPGQISLPIGPGGSNVCVFVEVRG